MLIKKKKIDSQILELFINGYTTTKRNLPQTTRISFIKSGSLMTQNIILAEIQIYIRKPETL